MLLQKYKYNSQVYFHIFPEALRTRVAGTASIWGMQILCLQLEASSLQVSFFAHSCVWECLLTIRIFVLTLEAFLFIIQWERGV